MTIHYTFAAAKSNFDKVGDQNTTVDIDGEHYFSYKEALELTESVLPYYLS